MPIRIHTGRSPQAEMFAPKTIWQCSIRNDAPEQRLLQIEAPKENIHLLQMVNKFSTERNAYSPPPVLSKLPRLKLTHLLR